MTLEEYEATLSVGADNRMVKFLQEFQEVVDKIREKNGFPKTAKSGSTGFVGAGPKNAVSHFWVN